MNEAKQFATFYLGNILFGVEVLQVQEIIRFQTITRVPRANAAIRGLINLRGQIVIAIDLRKRMELEERTAPGQPLNIVIKRDDSAVSLLVDEIGDVVEPDDASFEPPPETLRGVAREMIRGAYQMDGRLLLALDIDKVITFQDEPLALSRN